MAVVEWDQEFRVSFWSGRAFDLFGWSEQDVLGKRPEAWQFVHEDDQHAVTEVMDDLLSGRVPRNISCNRNYTADGRVLYCEWYNSILKDAGGGLISVFSLIHDVTDRIGAEAQVRHLQKLESVGQLTGGIAHDFNNLLTVILGNAEQLSEAVNGQPELRGLVDMITGAASRGAKLTHQLLSFSRQQPLQPRPIDVNELLGGVRDLLGRTLGEDVELQFFTRASWTALIDPTQLESSLLNLCLNARDAMPGGGRLTIESSDHALDEVYADQHDEVEAGDYVMIAVSDTGTGIEADQLGRVFEPFFTTKETGKGTGLGLSMVYGFVKQSRGHIKIYSEPGQGTTMRLYLPRFRGPAEAVDDARSDSADVTGHETILVVEDDEPLRQFVVSELERLGYRVLQAPNGMEALGVIKSGESIDLLFTDVVMPGGINGSRLAEMAKAVKPRLRVLFTSGYTENAIVHHGRLDPGVQLLSKPYLRRELARRVREALR
ncbi:MAG: response regulator [Xanthomonadaceae bacterium]|nr:response regulator [Xanthomonadaceae bacterium]